MTAAHAAALEQPTEQNRGVRAAFVRRNGLPLIYAGMLFLIGSVAAAYIYSDCCIVFREPIRSDGYGYYAYLPALFVDHNLTMKTALAYRWTVALKPLGYNWYGIAPYPSTGILLDKYTLGTALLQSPSFLAAYAVAHVLGMPPYSAPYQTAVVIWALLIFGAGEFVLLRCLLRRHTSSISLLAACAVTFGTSVFHFAAYDGSYSHVYSFFLFALLLAAADAYRTRSTVSTEPLLVQAAGFGAILGLIALARVPNVIGGIIPFALIAERFLRTKNTRTFVLEIASLGAVALVIFAPQIAYWHAITGHLFLNSYQHESFDWLHPQIANFLFSIRRGVFFWTPILLIAVIGLPRFLKSEKVLAAAVLIVLILEVYICSSWWSWYFGMSFGVRPITDMMPLIALPMAYGLEWLRAKTGRAATDSAVSLLIALNVILMLSYWRELIPMDQITLADFAKLPARWEATPFLNTPTARWLALATLGDYSPGTPFLADREPPHGMWIEGFDDPGPARWTIGSVTSLYIRPVMPPKGDLLLKLNLAGKGALTSPGYPRQRAVIKVNGTVIGAMAILYPQPKMRWTFVLPRKLFHDGQIARIDLELPDAAAPARLGINSDPRPLGLYVHRIDILPAGML
jgi:hypothetical protein